MITSKDFTTRVDFTGLPSASGADLNNGIELAIPTAGADETVGHGILLTTTDTASDVPDVPDPTVSADFTKWKRYQWNRRPFAGEADKRIKCYQWNDDAVNDATFLKWLETFVDTAQADADAANALATANNAVAIANNAGTLAGSAKTVADAATASVAAATAAAAAAQVAAGAAQVTATTGVTNAAAAQVTANQALGLAIRQSIFSIFSETKPKGTDAGASAGGKNTRVLNTVEWGGTAYPIALDVLTGIFTVSVGAYYWVEAEATMYDNGDNQHQLFLVDNASNANLLTGNSSYFISGGSTSQRATVRGLVQLINGQAIRLDHYIANLQAANGLGRAANVNPDAAGKEIYAKITMYPIGGN